LYKNLIPANLKSEDYLNASNACKSTCAALSLKCLKHKPEDFDCILELAMMWLQSIKSYQDAVAYFHKCIQLNQKEKTRIRIKLLHPRSLTII